MTKRARLELYVVFTLIGIMGMFMIFALLQARTQVRDNLRREDITNLKRALEQYQNSFGTYPTPPNGQDSCTQSTSTSWFFGEISPLVSGHFIDAIPHDVRESKGHTYRYCATQYSAEGATAYFLEASLEVPQEDTIEFDEDERRKFDYRILNENGKTLYRVCGGEESQCKP